ncbi:MAG: methylenetetrahydrofolate reductase [Prevotella sp.]|nr:methylenetetrahydrofolate reductase [Prevotella sp.]
MRVIDILRNSESPYPSLEIVPPLNGIRKDQLFDIVEQFMSFDLKYINVTYHRDEYEYREHPDGTYTRHIVRSRISPVAVCATLMAKYPVNMVPHVICAGQTSDEIDSLLYDLHFMGIDNVMTLRGDSLTGEKRFSPVRGGYRYASELVSAVKRFNEKTGSDFSIGVGGYPEKHFEAANIETDIANLKRKVDAGADYIITQMFFDNQAFYRFEKRCRDAGITVPIIPGLKPLSTLRHIALLPESFSIDIPLELTTAVQDAVKGYDLSFSRDMARANEIVYEIGTEWCITQCKDLLAHGVPAVHFYTMGKVRNIVKVLQSCF